MTSVDPWPNYWISFTKTTVGRTRKVVKDSNNEFLPIILGVQMFSALIFTLFSTFFFFFLHLFYLLIAVFMLSHDRVFNKYWIICYTYIVHTLTWCPPALYCEYFLEPNPPHNKHLMNQFVVYSNILPQSNVLQQLCYRLPFSCHTKYQTHKSHKYLQPMNSSYNYLVISFIILNSTTRRQENLLKQ